LGFEKEKFWVNSKYTLTSKQENISESFGETSTPGYNVIDLRLRVVLFENLTLGVADLNVFDETYHNHLNFPLMNLVEI
jgi:iron complex outermembrane receptor protein